MRAAALAAVLLAGCGPQPGAEVFVYAAASTADVAGDVAVRFEAAHPGVAVRLSVGATSTLARQLAAGAPGGVLIAADPGWVEWLAARRALGAPVVLARGHLVVVAREAGDWRAARRLALADPSHVPAGRYARAALDASGDWPRVAPHVVPTSDVRAALAAVESGAADAAIVYASDVGTGSHVRVVERFEGAGAPDIRYVGVVVRGSGALSQAFLDLAREDGVWERRGFDPAAR